MGEVTDDIKTQVIEGLCTDVSEIELTVRTALCLGKARIKFAAQLLTYSSKELRQNVFPNSEKSQKEIYTALEDLHIKRWFNQLIQDSNVRGMESREELRAFLENQPDQFFEKVISDDMFEEGSLIVQQREERLASVKAYLPTQLRGLNVEFYRAVALEIAEGDTPIEDVKTEAAQIILRRLNLNGSGPEVSSLNLPWQQKP